MKDKVSIVIPVYNGEKYLRKAIDSALNQTYKNIEIIVVNDGSTDKTDEICKEYKDSIVYIKKENGGVSSALNVALKRCSGKYFSWLSHDDEYYPNKIEYQMKYLKDNSLNNCILYSNYELIDENEKTIGYEQFELDELKKKPLYSLLRGNVNGITMLIPMEAFKKCGYFDERLRCTQDYDLWWKMIKEYPFVPTDRIITKTRIHPLQGTNTDPNVTDEGNKLWIKMIDDVSDETKIKYEGSIYNYYYEMASFLFTLPYNDAKEYCIKKCMEIDPNKYNKKPAKKKRRNIIKYIKKYGIKYTLKKVINKCFQIKKKGE